ncbi:c-type cytochrome [Agriterribacter sp.]|uniref:c-type cytochrome n=1 Tax=Agriterribacter sp. TaxID=2821509 RepID=UPI002C535504|nr:c-type cytochrome [Agriterribacter sp.]HTN06978.1 c-type cytochrome [Agriterribacter sp.]
MRTIVFVITLLCPGFTAIIISCNARGAAELTHPAITKDSLIKRGAYLVAVMGCDDCHSPKRMGDHGPEVIPERRLSGYQQDLPLATVNGDEIKKGWVLFSPDLTAAAGPWGVSFAANLTSDLTGIGSWTAAQFKKALREGKFKGLDNTRPLLPPMPWPNFAQLTDTDLEAVYTFLQSTKPVKNIVPAPRQWAATK